MEKKYVYRKHLQKPAKFFLMIALMIIIPYAIIALEITLSTNFIDKVEMGIVFFFVGLGLAVFIGIELLFIYLILYRRFKKIYFILTDEGMIYNNGKGEVRIPYESVQAIKFASIKYTGGWIKIIHNGGKIRLTVVLEDIGDMVKNLRDKIDEKNLSNIYVDKKMYNFIKTAKYSDQSWERIYENLKVFIRAVLISLGIAVIFSAFTSEILVKIILHIWALMGPLLVYLISEIIFGRKLAKGASKENFYVPNRDKEFEIKKYKMLFGIYAIIFFIMMIISIL